MVLYILPMPVLAGPYAVAAALLIIGGALKARDSAPTVGALRALGLRAPSELVRVLGAGEVGIGAAALLFDSRVVAALVAASYAAFAGFVVLALRRGTMVGSCGCFGRIDTPPTMAHVVVNATMAALSTAVAIRPEATSFAGALGDQPLLGGISLSLLVLTCAGLVYLTFTRLAQLNALGSRP